MDAIGIAFLIGFCDGAIGQKFSHQNMRPPPPPSHAYTVCLYCQERQPLHHASCVRRRRFFVPARGCWSPDINFCSF
jgi:hypothetical protein